MGNYSLTYLSETSGIGVKHWFWLGYNANGLYETWDIPKRNGKVRHIASPSSVLREAQYYIKRFILDPLPISFYAMAYAIGKNTALSATPHIGKPVVIRTDISDFFPSIGITKVQKVFLAAGWDSTSSRVLARVCLFQGGLAQGALTSPALSNLIMREADENIAAIGFKFGNMDYTRYSDDMVLSSSHNMSDRAVNRLLALVDNVLDRNGFMLNPDKTQIMRSENGRQSTLGIVLNERRTLPSQWKHNLRAGLYSTKRDLDAGTISPDEYEYLMRSLRGRYHYAKGIDPEYAAKLAVQFPQLLEGV